MDHTLMIVNTINGSDTPKNFAVLPRKLTGTFIRCNFNKIELIGLKFSLNMNLQTIDATSGGVTHGIRNIALKNPLSG